MRPDIIYDSSGQGLHIDNNRVNIVEDSAQFDRRGRLDIPYYANNHFGDKITVTFRFFDFPGGDTEQVLMSNCHASGKYGSIEIALRPSTDEVLFRIDTMISGMNEIAVPYQKKAWNNVRMTYDGQYLRGQVNSEENREMVRGYIQNRDRGVSIGQCGIRRRETKRAYVGYIDEDKTRTKANKEKPPPYEKKQTPNIGVRPGAQVESAYLLACNTIMHQKPTHIAPDEVQWNNYSHLAFK
ncbi:hypothetical protein FSP39_023372 [Pinctada imbricata]|uniref:Uncharacterized protein n=1 Tax=Pinctada imbricata TaxID=66713 RepID=A0AA89BL32_PINIB|nr:hypothetical protein FSP39_023372 [Pinctada imbricata]